MLAQHGVWNHLRTTCGRSLSDICQRARAWHLAYVYRQQAEVERLESRMLFSFVFAGSETLVNTNKTYAELNPVIAMDGSGKYVVVWSNNG